MPMDMSRWRTETRFAGLSFATNTSFCNFERQRKLDCHHMKIKSHVIAKLKPVCVQLKLQHAMNTIMTAAGFKVFL